MRYDSNIADIEPDEMYDIDELIHQTEKAYLFRTGKQQFWVPKSLVSYYEEDTAFIWYRFKPEYLPIVDEEDILSMFDDISDSNIAKEPDFSDIIKSSIEKFPTPFD